MLGIPRKVAEHRLCIQPDDKIVKQKLQRFTPERTKSIEAKVKKATGGRLHQASEPPYLACQPDAGAQAEWDATHVCRLHLPQQGVLKRLVSFLVDRSEHRLYVWMQVPLPPLHVLGLQ